MINPYLISIDRDKHAVILSPVNSLIRLSSTRVYSIRELNPQEIGAIFDVGILDNIEQSIGRFTGVFLGSAIGYLCELNLKEVNSKFSQAWNTLTQTKLTQLPLIWIS